MNSNVPITITDINNLPEDTKLKLLYDIFMSFSNRERKMFLLRNNIKGRTSIIRNFSDWWIDEKTKERMDSIKIVLTQIDMSDIILFKLERHVIGASIKLLKIHNIDTFINIDLKKRNENVEI